jgi:intein/homing endonuclease
MTDDRIHSFIHVTITGRYPVYASEVKDDDSCAYPPQEGTPAEIDRRAWEDKEVGVSDIVGWFEDDPEVRFREVTP